MGNIILLRHAKKETWSGVSQYDRCSTTLRALLTRSGSINTGLTAEDEKRLEIALGYPEGHLSKVSEFWHIFGVQVGPKGETLDISKPLDELKYLMCKSHKLVAEGYDRLTPSKDFILINKEAEAESKNRVNRKKREAIHEFDKMTPEQMRKCLRILGVNATNSSPEVVESTLYDYIETNANDFFTKWVDNKDKDIEYLIQQAVAKNVLRRNKTTYYYGTDVVGNSLEDTIAYLKDKANSDIRKAIQSAVESKETV